MHNYISLWPNKANLHKGVTFKNYLPKGVSFKSNYGGGLFSMEVVDGAGDKA